MVYPMAKYMICPSCGQSEQEHHGDKCKDCHNWTCRNCLAVSETINSPTLCQTCSARQKEKRYAEGRYR